MEHRFLSFLLIAALLISAGGCAAPAAEPPTEVPAAVERDDGLSSASEAEAAAEASAEADTAVTAERPLKEESADADNKAEDFSGAEAHSSQAETEEQTAPPPALSGVPDPFLTQTLRAFLEDEPGENRVYSPLNVYLALSMLPDLTEGETRQQILDLLGVKDPEESRERARLLWEAAQREDDAVTTLLASSLWLSDAFPYHEEALGRLSDSDYACSYRGTPGSPEMNSALRDWLNDRTGGLLKDAASQLELDPMTILAIASTIYFKAPWQDEFNASLTESGTFHSPDGDCAVDFLHGGSTGDYYWGEHFSAVCKAFRGGGAMWLILPEEGLSPEELLEDEEAMTFLLAPGGDWEKQRFALVKLALPKFDVSSDLDLRPGLRVLGVTDAQDPGLADFSPLTDEEFIYLAQAKHAARVSVDEKGCTGAAYTEMEIRWGSALPPEEIDFILNRPFLFLITDSTGLPLFFGTVNRPVS